MRSLNCKSVHFYGYSLGSTYSIMSDTTLYAIWEDHTHSFSSVWLCDESCHWRDCVCGARFETGEHSGPAATATTPQTCTVCGYEIAPAMGYTLTINYAVTSSGITVGGGSETVTGITPGTVVDLSKYWPGSEATGSDGNTYYFVGFTKKGEIAVVNSVTVTGDIELEAAWTAEEQVTVTFDTKGGTLPYARTRENYDESIYWMNREHIPVRAAYEFVGWSLADDGTADSSDTEITADCTLYAVWQSVEYFDDDSYELPPASIPIELGGDHDAVRISVGLVDQMVYHGNDVIAKFQNGTKIDMNNAALKSMLGQLGSGDHLQISAQKVAIAPTLATGERVIGAVNIAFDAVKVNSGEKTPIVASGKLAYTLAVNPAYDLSQGTVRAYKLMEDGSLSRRTAIVNPGGTVTIDSDSNSTYIVTFEPLDLSAAPPKTGDTSQPMLYLALLLGSLAGMIVLRRRMKV